MSREDARIALTEAVQTLQGSYPGGVNVEYPNQVELDPASQIAPFIRMKIYFIDGWRGSIGPAHHRVLGQLVLEFWTNQNIGLKPSNDLMQHFYPELHMKNYGSAARTFAARFVSGSQKSGWWVEPVLIPFWFDDIP